MPYQYIPFMLYGLAMSLFLALGLICWLDGRKQAASVAFADKADIFPGKPRRRPQATHPGMALAAA